MLKPGRSEAARIADQLRRAFEGEAWHGDSLFEILTGVTAAQAAAGCRCAFDLGVGVACCCVGWRGAAAV